MTEDERSGFWFEGQSRLSSALQKAEAEEVTKLQAEMEGADATRRAQLELEIRRVRANYKQQRRESDRSLFLADRPPDAADGE